MKRDTSLIREILNDIEEGSNGHDQLILTYDGKSKEEINYHLKLLLDQGYIEAVDWSSKNGLDYRPTELTWEGQDFLLDLENG